MNTNKTPLDRLATVLMWVSCFFTLLMMAHVTVDVFMRVVFNSPLVGTFEVVSYYYMVMVMYLPLAYVSMTEGQIIVELFTRGFGKRTLVVWDKVADIATAIYMLIFAWYTGSMAVNRTAAGELTEMSDRYIAVWPSRWVLPIAFGCLALFLIVRALTGTARHQDVAEV